MDHEKTLADTSSEQSRRIEAPPDVLALVVAYCAEQPELVGAVLVPPPGEALPPRPAHRKGVLSA